MIFWYWSVKGGVGTSVVAGAVAIRLATQNRDTTLVDLTGEQQVLLGMADCGLETVGSGINDWIAAGENVAADAIGHLLEDVTPNLRLLRQGKAPELFDVQSPKYYVTPDQHQPLRQGKAPALFDGGWINDGEDNAVEEEERASSRDKSGTSASDGCDRISSGNGLYGSKGISRLMLALDMLSRVGPVVVDAGLDPYRLRSHLSHEGVAICVLRACYLTISRAQRIPGPYDRIVLVQEPGRALRPKDIVRAIGGSEVECIAWDPRVGRAVDAGTLVSVLPPPLRRFNLPIQTGNQPE